MDQANLRLRAMSQWYESNAVPPSDQPLYVNAIAQLVVEREKSCDPATLLRQLMEIEATCGRVRSVPNAARTLDLDLIAIDDMVRHAPDPILPHPRAHQRTFVMAPLCDVAPGWVHPVLGQTAAALLAGLPKEGIRVMRG